MGMSLAEELDLDTANPNDDEKGLASGGVVPAGKYHARLVEASEDTAGEYSLDRMKFEILHGPSKGKIIEEDLFHSGRDEEKTRKAVIKRRTYYHRLGLLSKTEENGKSKYTIVPGKTDIRDCLGAEVIIDVEVFEDSWNDKKTGALKKRNKNKLSYMGIYKLDDPEVKGVPRGKSGSPLPPPAPKAKAADLDGI